MSYYIMTVIAIATLARTTKAINPKKGDQIKDYDPVNCLRKLKC